VHDHEKLVAYTHNIYRIHHSNLTEKPRFRQDNGIEREHMKKWVVANWKMNSSQELLAAYQATFKDASKLITCPPFVYLNEEGLNLGAQNVHHLPHGAYTGEISAQMLAEFGVGYCLVGHSERRHYFNETDKLIKTKADRCLEAGVTPIICIGESLDEYLNGQTVQVLKNQLEECLPDVTGFWLAYEPLWAIGTGKTPTINEITNVHAMLRQHLPGVVLLYGGSVNIANASDIFAIDNVDGVLVGGASLDIAAIKIIYASSVVGA
jgi:triosephosphate isomerase (TIM)